MIIANQCFKQDMIAEKYKDVVGFDNGDVINEVIKYVHDDSNEMCIFIPNWQAKPHHWERFCNHMDQYFNLDYFQTREKPCTKFKTITTDYSNEQSAADIIQYLNTHPRINYHLILCSFSVPLLISKWDELIYKPKSLTLICPITNVSLPWPVRLFASLPKKSLPILHKMLFYMANKTSALKPICKNHMTLFEEGNLHELQKFQASVRDVLKLKISHDLFEKIGLPTLIVMPLKDKIHSQSSCLKIHKKIKNSSIYEVENFRKAHQVEVAKEIQKFIQSRTETKRIVFRQMVVESE
ncbi:MAG: hypothetical protein RLZZ546_3395 [Bacteroidota bacterium]|jgi:hypothetical protein